MLSSLERCWQKPMKKNYVFVYWCFTHFAIYFQSSDVGHTQNVILYLIAQSYLGLTVADRMIHHWPRPTVQQFCGVPGSPVQAARGSTWATAACRCPTRRGGLAVDEGWSGRSIGAVWSGSRRILAATMHTRILAPFPCLEPPSDSPWIYTSNVAGIGSRKANRD